MAGGDAERIAHVAHRIKGTAASVSAGRLQRVAEQVEELGRGGRLSELSAQSACCGANGRDITIFGATAVKVLIVDDDDITTEILQNCLVSFGYEVAVARDGCEALELIRTGRYQIVVSDWEMPETDGIELCRQIRRRYAASYVYIILLTARRKTENVLEGLQAGADNFITKPFSCPGALPPGPYRRTDLGGRDARGDDLQPGETGRIAGHRYREAPGAEFREYSQVIANHLAGQAKFDDEIDGDYVHLIYLTSPLHDIGKVGIPDHVLLKPGPLTPEEFEIMKQHTIIGSQTLDAAAQAHPEAKFLRLARDIARSHHEKYDGSGYPDGLAAERIPLCGRIVALADVYDALTTKRVYKPAFSHVMARELIMEQSGRHFDPAMVLAFLQNEDRFQEIGAQFAAADAESRPAEPKLALTARG